MRIEVAPFACPMDLPFNFWQLEYNAMLVVLERWLGIYSILWMSSRRSADLTKIFAQAESTEFECIPWMIIVASHLAI